MRLSVLIAIVVAAITAHAQAPKDEAAQKPASAWLPEIEAPGSARVQRRFVTKAHRVFVDLGPEYLARGDFYASPGASLGVLAWFGEGWAADVAASRYFPFLTQAAVDVKEKTGRVPDSRAPYWLFRAGLRGSPGYGKLLVGESVLHLEPQVFARGALLVNDGSIAPGIDLGAALLLHWTRDFHTRFELAVFPHAERRTAWTAVVGVVPFISFGWGAPPW